MDVEDLQKGDKDSMKNMLEMKYGSELQSLNDHIYVLYIDPHTITVGEADKYSKEIIDRIKPSTLIILPNTSYLKEASKEEIETWIAYAQSRINQFENK